MSQANKWLSGDPLSATNYTEDPYYSDPVEAVTTVNKKGYEGEESIPLTKLSFKGTVIDGVQDLAQVDLPVLLLRCC